MHNKNICTIKNWSVEWNKLGNTLVCTHEYVHQSFLVSTIYGCTQKLIQSYAEVFPKDLQLIRVQYLLFKNVNFLQECCATYASVMQVTNNNLKKKINIPASYRHYFLTFHEKFKIKVNSTYFAYILSTTISSICMNNYIYDNVISFLEGNSKSFDESAVLPNYTFKEIMNTIDDNIIERLICYCNIQNSDRYSDLNKDEYWIKHSNNEKLNMDVFGWIYSFITKECKNLNIMSLEEVNKKGSLGLRKLNDYLMEKYKDIGIVIEDRYVHTYVLNEERMMDLECIDTTIIYNKPYLRVKGKVTDGKEIGINYKNYHRDLFLHTYLCENGFWNVDDRWYQYNSDGSRYDSACFLFEHLPVFLKNNALFVIGILANEKKKELDGKLLNVKQKINKIYLESKVKKKKISRYYMFFYMFGKISQWLDYFIQYNKCKYSLLIIDDNSIEKNDKNQYMMLGIYSVELPGIFVKCFNNMNARKMLGILESLEKQSLIEKDFSGENKIVGEKMTQAFHAIDSIWLEL